MSAFWDLQDFAGLFFVLRKILWAKKIEKNVNFFFELFLVFCIKLRYDSGQVVESGVLWCLVVDKWRVKPKMSHGKRDTRRAAGRRCVIYVYGRI